VEDVTAVLLCGGKGERLKPFTDTAAKPLVPLNGRPLLEYLIAFLASRGVDRFVVCVGHHADAVRAFVRNEVDSALEIVCVDSGDASMTDRILDASAEVEGRMLVCYGDVLSDVDVAALCAEHERTGALVTVTVYPLDSPFGVVEYDAARRVSGFQEKPRLPYWVNIGFLLCEPRIVSYLSRGSDMPAFLTELADAGLLYAFEHVGKYLTVNTEKDRLAAEMELGLFSMGTRE
jgi:mannose-1-phosphate guanylyltransferase